MLGLSKITIKLQNLHHTKEWYQTLKCLSRVIKGYTNRITHIHIRTHTPSLQVYRSGVLNIITLGVHGYEGGDIADKKG